MWLAVAASIPVEVGWSQCRAVIPTTFVSLAQPAALSHVADVMVSSVSSSMGLTHTVF